MITRGHGASLYLGSKSSGWVIRDIAPPTKPCCERRARVCWKAYKAGTYAGAHVRLGHFGSSYCFQVDSSPFPSANDVEQKELIAPLLLELGIYFYPSYSLTVTLSFHPLNFFFFSFSVLISLAYWLLSNQDTVLHLAHVLHMPKPKRYPCTSQDYTADQLRNQLCPWVPRLTTG